MDVMQRFTHINAKSSGDSYKPHKPLLLLVALSRAKQGKPRLARFLEYEEAFDSFKDVFGNLNVIFPFARLVSDHIWEVTEWDTLQRNSSGDLLKSELVAQGILGGLNEDIYEQVLSDDPQIVNLTAELLKRFIPAEFHQVVRARLSLPNADDPPTPALPHADGLSATSKCLISDAPELGGTKVAPPAANDFIAYLNSLHSVRANGGNALAESQAVNPFFGDLYEPFPLVDPLKKLLRDQADHVVILSGHAGDGKSTVALDVYKALRGLDSLEPLTTPLREREPIALGTRAVTIVKDMSELSTEQRKGRDEDPGFVPISWEVIVSNTGPLLNSLREYGKDRGRPEAENDILALLDQPLNAERLEEHALAGFGKPLIVLNLSRFDNTELGTRLLGRLINHPGWQGCDGCPAQTHCPIGLNRRAVCDAGMIRLTRLRWLYRRISAYEQRLTLPEIVAQLAFSLTGGMSCAQAKAAVELGSAGGAAPATDALAEIVFSEGFFGYRAGRPWPDGQGLRAVELAHRSHFGGPVINLVPGFETYLGNYRVLHRMMKEMGVGYSLLCDPTEVLDTPADGEFRMYDGGTPLAEMKDAPNAIDTLLRSPGLRLLDESRQQCRLALSPVDAGKLRDACLDVLREAFSSFTASQFDPRDHELYLTLRRPDRAVIQPTQLVVGSLSLSRVVLKKRATANSDDRAAWEMADLLFISNYGDKEERRISFAHFVQDDDWGDLPTLKVLGWDADDRLLHLDDARSHQEAKLRWPPDDGAAAGDVHRYILDKDADGKPQRLVKQR